MYISQPCSNRRSPFWTASFLGNSAAGSIGSEPSSVSSRCSVRIIHDIISKFGAEKTQLIQSIGFGGILHIPMIKQINLRFSTWLMSRVDELAQTLLIGDATRIQFNKHDVAKVFGIPSTGKSLFSTPASSGRDVLNSLSPESTIDIKKLRSIKQAQAIVSRVYGRPMSSHDQDEFKVAFVVFVMSTLLAPNAKHDRVFDDFTHIIKFPADIADYDWADYVFRRLLDAVSKLKSDIANSVKVPYLYGCSLFLQVIHLDAPSFKCLLSIMFL